MASPTLKKPSAVSSFVSLIACLYLLAGEAVIQVRASSSSSSISSTSSTASSTTHTRNTSGSDTTCTNPVIFTPIPGSFTVSDYTSYREQCNDKCNAAGYCCTKSSGMCGVVPCSEGCHIAFFSDDLAACKAECAVANDQDDHCNYTAKSHSLVGYLGFHPRWPDTGVDKCMSPEDCGCIQWNGLSNECSNDACIRGCELAYEADIRDSSFNGENTVVDPLLELSAVDLRSSLASIQSHIDGSSPLSDAQLRSVQETFDTNSDFLEFDFESMDSAFAIIDTYESKYDGGMFINSRTDVSGFPRDDSDDGFTLERVILVVQQAILDTVYVGTNYLSRLHDSVIENCQYYLRERYWKTSAYFPGFVALPSQQSTTIHSIDFKGTVKKYWGREECFSKSSAIHATGLYLPPGGVAWVTFPSALVDKGFEIQVGANDVNTDNKPDQKRINRVTCTHEIKNTKTFIASPLGGGIYIKVPYLSNYGTQSISVSGDVIEAPFFSMTNLKTTSRAEWNILKDSAAPWTDFETEYFMQVVPTSWIAGHSFDHFKALMEGRDASMKAFNYISGYPDDTKNKQVLYLQPDLHIRADAYGVGYPQVNILVESTKDGIVADTDNMLMISPTMDGFGEVTYHEAAHCSLTATYTGFDGEIEAIVNFPYAYIQHTVGGQDFDYAFTYTMGRVTGILTPDYASVDWMITENFRDGNEMGKEWPRQEFQYQPRGYAKYADITTLFGFETLHNFFYQEHLYVEDGKDDYGRPEGYDHDDWRTLRLSIQAGVDLRPLMHFWGVHPEDEAKLKTSMEENGLQPSMDVYNLIKYRLDMIPKNNAEFLDLFSVVWPGWEDKRDEWGCSVYLWSECGLYYIWMNKWDEAIANKAKTVGEAILSLYYDDVAPSTPQTPAPVGSTLAPVASTLAPVGSPTPSSTVSDCVDSPLRLKVFFDGRDRFKDCNWIATNPTNRCKKEGISAMCPKTCGTCGTCADTTTRFKVVIKGKKRSKSCVWADNWRCQKFDGLADTCRLSCGTCTV